MGRKLSLATIALVGLVLLGLLTGVTINRLARTDRLWAEQLTKQGAFILGTMEASSRAGMRMMRPNRGRRLQYLTEEMAQVDLVVSVFIIDESGLITVHSDPRLVGQHLPEAAELWRNARLGLAAFDGDSFIVARPFIPRRRPRPHHMMPLLMSEEPRPQLGVVRLPLNEYHAARRAELVQAVGFGSAIFVAGLAVMAMLLLFHDRRLLNRLRETTGHLVEHVPAGLLAADERGRVITANRVARRLLGLKPDHKPGRLADYLPDGFCRDLAALRGDRVMAERPTELTAGEAKIPVALSAVGMEPTPEDPTSLIILIRDLREVKELEERLKRSERLAALGRLSAGVAHEIRNPLSSIRGLAQYLKRKLEPDSAEAGYAEVMIGEADRLDRVVSDLLAYARPQPPQLSPGDLNEVARRVIDLTATQADEAGVAVAAELDGPLELDLDEQKITQVILNLLINALESGADRVEIKSESDRDWARLWVTDNGPGVAPEDRSHLFDPFFTTKARGSGLGLAISVRLVEEQGGRLELKDGEPGNGAAFELALPLSDPAKE